MPHYINRHMNSSVQLRLSVPFEQKDVAKALGARWEQTERCWYVPHGLDINVFSRWWPKGLKAADKASRRAANGVRAVQASRGGASPSKRVRASSGCSSKAGHSTGPASVEVDPSSALPWE